MPLKTSSYNFIRNLEVAKSETGSRSYLTWPLTFSQAQADTRNLDNANAKGMQT